MSARAKAGVRRYRVLDHDFVLFSHAEMGTHQCELPGDPIEFRAADPRRPASASDKPGRRLIERKADAAEPPTQGAPEERTGMRGGVVVVRGHAGMRVADRLRRGLVIIEGDAGVNAGSGMVAGTLVVCGAAGALPGILMRRGTIVLGRPAELAPSFIATSSADLIFTRLLARTVAAISNAAAACVHKAGSRYAGDMAVLGTGELLFPGSARSIWPWAPTMISTE